MQKLVVVGFMFIASACGSSADEKAAPPASTSATATATTTAATVATSTATATATEASTATIQTFPSLAVTSQADLPTCVPQIETSLAYVERDEQFFVCRAYSWTKIDVGIHGANGRDGNDGEEGAAGSDGKDGKDGTDNRIVETLHCAGLFESDDYLASYDFVKLASGDVIATGSVANALDEAGTTSYYAAGQNGATSGDVVFTKDSVGSANFGWWELVRDDFHLEITYHDTDLVDGKKSWTIGGGSSCQSNKF